MRYNWSVVVIWLEMRSTKCLIRPSRNCEQLRKGMGECYLEILNLMLRDYNKNHV